MSQNSNDNCSKQEYVFFLGGHDAEMCEIHFLLEQKDMAFYDKKLSWGATLSAYAKELPLIGNETPVFIELIPDIPFPAKSIIVDHHNQAAGDNRPTSIEQVAKLLGVELNHRQKLIAANDRAHIKGMIKAGATADEIAEIRAVDRRCQGVTADEEIAAEGICAKFESCGELDILNIPFKHTSPITDRLFDKYRNLLIITPADINFFGQGEIVLQLGLKFESSWYGGNLPEIGFWGVKKKSQRQIDAIIYFLKKLIK